MKKMKRFVIPHEHGGWAMVSIPFLFGMIAGEWTWMHLPMFLAWLFLYLSSYPFLQSVKRSSNRPYWIKWGVMYGAIAILCLIPPLIQEPRLLGFGPVLVLLLTVNIWHAKRKSERAIINDLCAILIFSIGGAAAYMLGGGRWDRVMAAVVLFSFLHFMGSAFFVKTIFRERGSSRWILYTRIYHVLLFIIPAIVGYPWFAIAYVYSAVRAFAFAGKPMRPWKAGMIEIVCAVQFLLLAGLYISMSA